MSNKESRLVTLKVNWKSKKINKMDEFLVFYKFYDLIKVPGTKNKIIVQTYGHGVKLLLVDLKKKFHLRMFELRDILRIKLLPLTHFRTYPLVLSQELAMVTLCNMQTSIRTQSVNTHNTENNQIEVLKNYRLDS